jgi:hypothetical protein
MATDALEPVLKMMLEKTGDLEGRLKALLDLVRPLSSGTYPEQEQVDAMRRHVCDAAMDVGMLQGSLMSARQLYLNPPCA